VQQLEERFIEMLSYAASKRPVILMADALNQFERTDRVLAMSWLPDPLPTSVRLLATAIPGVESERLGHRRGGLLTGKRTARCRRSGASSLNMGMSPTV